MPTHDELRRFLNDYSRLTESQQVAFRSALRLFIAGLRSGRFDPRLRLKRMHGYPGVWELSWAPDGRATFQYGQELQPGQPHVIWRRVRPLHLCRTSNDGHDREEREVGGRQRHEHGDADADEIEDEGHGANGSALGLRSLAGGA